jgi:hypothetical protein
MAKTTKSTRSCLSSAPIWGRRAGGRRELFKALSNRTGPSTCGGKGKAQVAYGLNDSTEGIKCDQIYIRPRVPGRTGRFLGFTDGVMRSW